MISQIINNIKDKELKEDIAYGLAVGLVVGLAVGLAYGLAFGLASGLAVGLAYGLVVGLVVGLASGLASGLAVGLAYGLAVGLASGLANLSQLLPLELKWILLLIIGIIVLSELLFNGKGYEKGSKFWFACKRKIESLFESLIIIVNGLNIRWLFVKYKILDKIPYELILKWTGYIGTGIIVIAAIIGIFYLWIKINEKRVRK